VHLNVLTVRALEPTPIALKRDLDLAIAEITQMKRDMRILQRELRENGKETRAAREAQAAAEEEAKKTRVAIKTAEATAQDEAKKTKAAGAALDELKRTKTDNKTVKATTGATTKIKAKKV